VFGGASALEGKLVGWRYVTRTNQVREKKMGHTLQVFDGHSGCRWARMSVAGQRRVVSSN
jgi:hypothetical protein